MASLTAQRRRRRFVVRPDAEHVQVAVRLVVVAIAAAYFLTDSFAARAGNPEAVLLARWASACSVFVSIALAVAVFVEPGVSTARRLSGILHDVAALSTALYLGEGGVAGLAVIYLWVSLSNGFRYGNAYLYGTAVLSIGSFLAVIALSEYWRAQTALSATLLAVMVLIPPYVATLLATLRRAREQLRRQASIDVLTGLKNRIASERAIERHMDDDLCGHALLFCDLDLFKQVNDDAGHAAGDKLLGDIARIIGDCAGEHDVAGRLGGDEFCVFLVNSRIERARRVAEDIRNRVSGYRLAWGKQYYSVGISIGVAPTSAVRDMASLFRLADAACYAAKNAGRNQVHVVDPRTGIEDTQRIRKLFADNALAATTRIDTGILRNG